MHVGAPEEVVAHAAGQRFSKPPVSNLCVFVRFASKWMIGPVVLVVRNGLPHEYRSNAKGFRNCLDLLLVRQIPADDRIDQLTNLRFVFHDRCSNPLRVSAGANAS
jgi:hypothetical protein